jgi:hypothetical protein
MKEWKHGHKTSDITILQWLYEINESSIQLSDLLFESIANWFAKQKIVA